jgi:hypothetical protein
MYPAFNEAHPPLMTDPNVFPPKRSASARIGQPFRIQQKDFFRVNDQQYPWVGMRHDSPSQWQRGKDLQVAHKHEVDHYLVIREQYWALFDRRMYGMETVDKVSIEQGTTYSHKEVRRESTTSRFAVTLGLNLTDNIFGVTLGKSSVNSNFNYEFSRALKFTETDEITYRETEIHSRETKFAPDTQYLYWQVCNDVLLYRIKQQRPVIRSGCAWHAGRWASLRFRALSPIRPSSAGQKCSAAG